MKRMGSKPGVAHGPKGVILVPFVAVILAALLVGFGSTEVGDGPWPDDVAGIWNVAFTQHGGPPVAVPPGELWFFDDEKRILYWANEHEHRAVSFRCVFSVGKHRQLDLIPHDKQRVALRAIYEILDDKMRVTGGPLNGPRPTEFVEPGTDNHTTFLQHKSSPARQSRKTRMPQLQGPLQSSY